MARQPMADRGQDVEQDVHYTAFIRLPFPRGDFIDPPLVDWDASKDRALWQILSRNPRSSDLDWKELASKFQVTLPFILQQAAWLYERQLSQVRAQMRKVSKDTVSSSTQASDRTNAAPTSQAMQRIASSEKRRLSSGGADTPSLNSAPATPRVGYSAPREQPTAGRQAPPMSRNTSTNTITPSRPFPQLSPSKQQQPAGVSARASLQRSPRQASGLSPPERKGGEASTQDSSTTSEESSESDSSSDHATPSKSQMFRRPPLRFMGGRTARARVQVITGDGTEDDDDDEETNKDGDDDEEEEDTPAFLPLSGGSQEQQQEQDLGATLRHAQQEGTATPDSRGVTKIDSRANTDSSVSSAGSAAAVAIAGDGGRSARPPGPLSARQQAEMAKLSPRRRGAGREGSDGTRSMGSSFSDLDDTSVTQSALEEALMSNMQHGGGASRVSSISQALRSRYQ